MLSHRGRLRRPALATLTFFYVNLLMAVTMPAPVEARVNPLQPIIRQLQKANMLVVLDTSGSLTSVPGGLAAPSNEVGVDCDNGVNCRGGVAGYCRGQTSKVCLSDKDCQEGTCQNGGQPCRQNTDCQGTPSHCTLTSDSCVDNSDCPEVAGTCSVTGASCDSNNPCVDVPQCQYGGAACTVGAVYPAAGSCAPRNIGVCKADSNTTCQTKEDCPGVCAVGNQVCTASNPCPTSGNCQYGGATCNSDGDCAATNTVTSGSCRYGNTPAGGCTTDGACSLQTSGTCTATGSACTSQGSCANTCVTNADCPSGVCQYSPSKTCTQWSDCDEKFCVDNGGTNPNPARVKCTVDAQCAASFPGTYPLCRTVSTRCLGYNSSGSFINNRCGVGNICSDTATNACVIDANACSVPAGTCSPNAASVCDRNNSCSKRCSNNSKQTCSSDGACFRCASGDTATMCGVDSDCRVCSNDSTKICSSNAACGTTGTCTAGAVGGSTCSADTDCFRCSNKTTASCVYDTDCYRCSNNDNIICSTGIGACGSMGTCSVSAGACLSNSDCFHCSNNTAVACNAGNAATVCARCSNDSSTVCTSTDYLTSCHTTGACSQNPAIACTSDAACNRCANDPTNASGAVCRSDNDCGVCGSGATAVASNPVCASPYSIPSTGGVFTGTTSGSDTTTGSCASATGAEAVFQWTPTATGTAVISTCGSSYDTVLYVRSGTCAGGTELVCNNDYGACGTGSQVSASVTSGTTYYLFVDGLSGSGNYKLSVAPPGAGLACTANPAVCATTGGHCSWSGSKTCNSDGDCNTCLNPTNGHTTTDSCTVATVAANCGSQGTCVDGAACYNDAACYRCANLPTQACPSGTGADCGVCAPTATSVGTIGTCTAPVVLPAAAGKYTGTIASGSGTEAGTGSCASTSQPDSIFQWTPTIAGTWTIDTKTSSFDTLLYVRSGATCSGGSQVACDDDSGGGTGQSQLTYGVTSGSTYYLVVDGKSGGAGGTYTLNLTPPTSAQTTCSSTNQCNSGSGSAHCSANPSTTCTGNADCNTCSNTGAYCASNAACGTTGTCVSAGGVACSASSDCNRCSNFQTDTTRTCTTSDLSQCGQCAYAATTVTVKGVCGTPTTLPTLANSGGRFTGAFSGVAVSSSGSAGCSSALGCTWAYNGPYVVFKWTPSAGTYIVDTSGSSATTAPVVISTSACGAATCPSSCTAPGYQQATYTVSAGTYYVQVYGASTAGTYHLNITSTAGATHCTSDGACTAASPSFGNNICSFDLATTCNSGGDCSRCSASGISCTTGAGACGTGTCQYSTAVASGAGGCSSVGDCVANRCTADGTSCVTGAGACQTGTCAYASSVTGAAGSCGTVTDCKSNRCTSNALDCSTNANACKTGACVYATSVSSAGTCGVVTDCTTNRCTGNGIDCSTGAGACQSGTCNYSSAVASGAGSCGSLGDCIVNRCTSDGTSCVTGAGACQTGTCSYSSAVATSAGTCGQAVDCVTKRCTADGTNCSTAASACQTGLCAYAAGTAGSCGAVSDCTTNHCTTTFATTCTSAGACQTGTCVYSMGSSGTCGSPGDCSSRCSSSIGTTCTTSSQCNANVCGAGAGYTYLSSRNGDSSATACTSVGDCGQCSNCGLTYGLCASTKMACTYGGSSAVGQCWGLCPSKTSGTFATTPPYCNTGGSCYCRSDADCGSRCSNNSGIACSSNGGCSTATCVYCVGASQACPRPAINNSCSAVPGVCANDCTTSCTNSTVCGGASCITSWTMTSNGTCTSNVCNPRILYATSTNKKCVLTSAGTTLHCDAKCTSICNTSSGCGTFGNCQASNFPVTVSATTAAVCYTASTNPCSAWVAGSAASVTCQTTGTCAVITGSCGDDTGAGCLNGNSTYQACNAGSGGATCNAATSCSGGSGTCAGATSCSGGKGACASSPTCTGGKGACATATSCTGGGGSCTSRTSCSSGGGQCSTVSSCTGGKGACASATSCSGGGGTCTTTNSCSGQATCNSAFSCVTTNNCIGIPSCLTTNTCSGAGTCDTAQTCQTSFSCGSFPTCKTSNTCDAVPSCNTTVGCNTSNTCTGVPNCVVGSCTTAETCQNAPTCSVGATCVVSSSGTPIKCDVPTCSTGGTCGKAGITCNTDSCTYPTNKCVGGGNNCTHPDPDACDLTNTCVNHTQLCNQAANICDQGTQNQCILPSPNTDTCNLAGATQHTLGMCHYKQTVCLADSNCQNACSNDSQCLLGSHCTAGKCNDYCGPASSRAIIAKRAIKTVTQANYNLVNFGLMTYWQSGYYPYFNAGGSSPTTECRYTYVPKGKLEAAGCFSDASGPTNTCPLGSLGENWTLSSASSCVPPAGQMSQPDGNSQYKVHSGSGDWKTYDRDWSTQNADCNGRFCTIKDSSSGDAIGTGIYQGSYYSFTQVTSGTFGSKVQSRQPKYIGKNANIGGKDLTYYNSRPDYYNGGSSAVPPISPAQCGWNTGGSFTCTPSCGGIWNWDSTAQAGLAPFLDWTGDLATNKANVLEIGKRMEPANYGGLITWWGTPTGCTLRNGIMGLSNSDPSSMGSTDLKTVSAYHYMKNVYDNDPLSPNPNNGASGCRRGYVIMVTDGEANGPGDADGAGNSLCTSAACDITTNPTLAGCACRPVLAARSMVTDLQTQTFLVNFGADATAGEAATIGNNIAKAGTMVFNPDGSGAPSTPPPASAARLAYSAMNEQQLIDALQRAIYEAIRGNYATSEASTSMGSIQNGVYQSGGFALDPRVQFPSWQGQLNVLDVNSGARVWEASYTLSLMDWWKRNIYTYAGAANGGMVKFLFDQSAPHSMTNSSTVWNLGFNLGASWAETELAARWAAGDTTMANPAVLGAIVNSTAIDVGQPSTSSMPGAKEFFDANANRPNLLYFGASDGMLHAFFTKDVTIGSTTHTAGEEAFAYIPPPMLDVIRKLYAQGGQMPDPRDHIFGLASSPKVKDICLHNCDGQSGTPDWRTVLIMSTGFGGNDMFMLDITTPVDLSTGAILGPNVLWDSSVDKSSSYNALLGETISVPGFYFQRDSSMARYRIITASGYPLAGGASGQGTYMVTTDALSGDRLDSEQFSQGSCSLSSDMTPEYTVLADVATARDYKGGQYDPDNPGNSQNWKLLAGYVGDTWGNLWRYQLNAADSLGNQSNSGTSALVAAFTCSHPLHFSPTVVQLDRYNSANRSHEVYLVQVTNSHLDSVTEGAPGTTNGFPASKMVIMRDRDASSNGVLSLDTTFGTSGQIVLETNKNATDPTGICGIQDPSTHACTMALGGDARPAGTPLAIIKGDGTGFMLLSLWYVPATDGCSKGATYMAVHDITPDRSGSGAGNGVVVQTAGQQVANEPVSAPVVVNGKIEVVTSTNGLQAISGNLGLSLSAPPSTAPSGGTSGIPFRSLGWQELP